MYNVYNMYSYIQDMQNKQNGLKCIIVYRLIIYIYINYT